MSDRVPYPPNKEARFGTVPGQFDIYHTLIWGTGEELKFGLSVTLMAALIGTLIGAISGYWGGVMNRIVMRITDGFLTFPVIAAVVFFSAIFSILYTKVGINVLNLQSDQLQQVGMIKVSDLGFTGLTGFLLNIILSVRPFYIAIILFSWMPYTRMINDQVLRIKQAEYVLAAQSVGIRKIRMVFKHILPNAIAPNIVLATRDVGGMVILRATFTYIGLADGSYWTTILLLGNKYVIGPGGSPGTYWWVYLPVTIAIVLFGLGWNMFGDELNFWLNPRERSG